MDGRVAHLFKGGGLDAALILVSPTSEDMEHAPVSVELACRTSYALLQEANEMRQLEVRDALRKEPFQPCRIHLSNGQSYDVCHPEFAALTRTSVVVVVPSSDKDDIDRVVQCDFVHVIAMEAIGGAST